MSKRIKEKVWMMSPIIPESDFFHVGGDMLGVNSVPSAHDLSLQEPKAALNRIGMNLPEGVLMFRMVDVRMVPESCFSRRVPVGLEFIRDN